MVSVGKVQNLLGNSGVFREAVPVAEVEQSDALESC